MSFDLDDFDLARQHRAGLDRQIVEALTGEQDVEPSDMDLWRDAGQERLSSNTADPHER